MFLYAIAEDRSGPCKIGYAADPHKRLVDLQIGNPRKLSLVWSVETEHYRRAERFAHRRAGLMHHIRGEWFSVDIVKAKEAVIFGCEEAAHVEHARLMNPSGLHSLLTEAYRLTRKQA